MSRVFTPLGVCILVALFGIVGAVALLVLHSAHEESARLRAEQSERYAPKPEE